MPGSLQNTKMRWKSRCSKHALHRLLASEQRRYPASGTMERVRGSAWAETSARTLYEGYKINRRVNKMAAWQIIMLDFIQLPFLQIGCHVRCSTSREKMDLTNLRNQSGIIRNVLQQGWLSSSTILESKECPKGIHRRIKQIMQMFNSNVNPSKEIVNTDELSSRAGWERNVQGGHACRKRSDKRGHFGRRSRQVSRSMYLW